jgi:hypothetical protein
MQRALHKIAAKVTLVCLLTSGLTLGCKAARVEQCNRLIDAINGLDLTPPAGEDGSAVAELAKKAETGAVALEAVPLQDAQLGVFRKRYQDNLRAFAKVNREVSVTMHEVKKLEGAADPSGKVAELNQRLDAQKTEIDQRAQESSKLTSEINTYCSGPNRRP